MDYLTTLVSGCWVRSRPELEVAKLGEGQRESRLVFVYSVSSCSVGACPVFSVTVPGAEDTEMSKIQSMPSRGG